MSDQPTQRFDLPQRPPAPPAYDVPPTTPLTPEPPAPGRLASRRPWFNQSDNVLMAVTAFVAVAFLVLLAILH